MAADQSDGFTKTLADIITTYRQLSAFSATMFEPLARMYVGNLAARSERPLEAVDIANLALKKLMFEAGELAMASASAPATAETRAVDALAQTNGTIPDLKLAHLAAGILLYMKLREQRETSALERTRAAQAQPTSSSGSVRSLRTSARAALYAPQAQTTRMVGGCGCAGGASPSPPPAATEVCAPSCGCAQCKAIDTTIAEVCPPFLSISCETRSRLKECVKIALCKFVETLGRNLCTPPDPPPATPLPPNPLRDAVCAFLQCLPDALCPPTRPYGPVGQVGQPCLPCGYAVDTRPTVTLPSTSTSSTTPVIQ
ncbi:MAG: hypothetical protein KF773_02455 [Deltaproteobacteria bacterium]|nr:hypothetical protein [Deltaproteobacteria bacterium]